MANRKQTVTQLRITKVLLVTGPTLVMVAAVGSSPEMALLGLIICGLAWWSGNLLICPGCGKKAFNMGSDLKYCMQCGTPYFDKESDQPSEK